MVDEVRSDEELHAICDLSSSARNDNLDSASNWDDFSIGRE